MATIEAAVFERLTTFAATAALIESRCYPSVAPQDASMPAIVYQEVSSHPQISHNGFSNLIETRIQITSLADDYAGAKALDLAVRAAFNAVRFVAGNGIRVMLAKVDNEADDYNAAEAEPVVRTDVMLWHDAG